MKKITALFIFITLVVQSPNLLAQDSLSGDWEGAIDLQGTELTIITHFKSVGNEFEGTIDIPQQGGQDIPLQNISLSNQDSVQFEFMTSLGLASFEGAIQGDKITGTFRQNNQTFPFVLKRQPAENAERLTIMNGDISLAGTLTLPDQTPSACVILLSGSGAQDRDSNIYGFKPFQKIADHLAEHGVATFRYDDRGVGESSGSYEQTSRSDHLQDLRAVVKELKQRQEINPQNIGVLGHSKGGIIAGAAAVQHPENISFVVLMASPAQPLGETVIGQVKTILQEQNAPDSLITRQMQLQQSIFDTLRGSQNFDSLQKVLESQIVEKIRELPESQRKTIENPQSYAASQAQQQIRALQQPAYFSFLDYNADDDLRKIKVPVLAMYAEKDTQVLLDENKSIARQALEQSGTTYKILVFKDANHLFQKAETGSVQEYSQLNPEFVDGFLPTLSEWISNHIRK